MSILKKCVGVAIEGMDIWYMGLTIGEAEVEMNLVFVFLGVI